MDMDYLLHRQQVERIRADSASCEEARRAHAQLAVLYEKAIERLASLSFLGMPERTRKQNWSNELRLLANAYAGNDVREAGALPRPDRVPN
jgi:hypothetical protein